MIPAPGPSSTAPAGMLSTQPLFPSEPQFMIHEKSATWRMRPPPALAETYGRSLSEPKSQVSFANAATAVDGGDEHLAHVVSPDRNWIRACTDNNRSGLMK